MNRREFILSAAAAGALAPNVLSKSLGKTGPVPVVDTHTHFFDPTRPEGIPYPPKSDRLNYSPHYPKDFSAVAKRHNVVGTVVVEASQWLEDNAWILELAESNEEILGLIGSLIPGDPDFAINLKRFSENPLFLGLRLRGEMNQRIGEKATLRDLKRVADRDLTIDIHGGVPIIEPTLMMSRKMPSLRIVVNHLPFSDWDGDVPAMKSTLADLVRQPNVFVKVSEVVRRVNGEVMVDPDFYRPGLDALLDLFGPDRLVFGSNWPVCKHIADYANMFRVVDEYFATQARSVAEKYFWRNSLVAYKWIPRGDAAKLLA